MVAPWLRAPVFLSPSDPRRNSLRSPPVIAPPLVLHAHEAPPPSGRRFNVSGGSSFQPAPIEDLGFSTIPGVGPLGPRGPSHFKTNKQVYRPLSRNSDAKIEGGVPLCVFSWDRFTRKRPLSTQSSLNFPTPILRRMQRSPPTKHLIRSLVKQIDPSPPGTQDDDEGSCGEEGGGGDTESGTSK